MANSKNSNQSTPKINAPQEPSETEYLNQLIARVKKAQQLYAQFTQEQVMKFFVRPL